MSEAARLEDALARGRPRALRPRRRSSAAASRATGSRSPTGASTYAAPGEPLPVDGAPEIVAQMLDKLVDNAVEFTTGGAVEIALARDGDRRDA